MSNQNASTVRKAYQDFAQGDVPAVFAAFDPNIVWYVPGDSPLAGEYRGHEGIGGFFQRTMELTQGAFSMDVHNVLADGDIVVVLVTVNAQRKGVSAAFPEVHVWRLNNGKVVSFREYQGDEHRENKFWS